jgi:hypothetical protein
MTIPQEADGATSAGAAPSIPWQKWDAAEWGSAFFEYYFVATQRDEPVLRLSVTAEELAKVARAARSDALFVRDAFLTAIACTPDEFRAHLRTSRLTGGEWRGSTPPPFLPYLIFTCYAAATLDEVVAEEGDFRRRLRDLLDHPQGTSYDLEDLPKLWHALRGWLTRLRGVGASVRRLDLPDPGYMNRIGHSVRLAFPQRRDRERLVGVLAEISDEAFPTVPEAFAVVAQGIRQFSSNFQELFQGAKDTLANGGDSSDLRLVWSALHDAATSRPIARSVATEKPRFHLLAYDDDRGRLDPVVVTNRLIETGKTGITCKELPDRVDEHSHFLANGQWSTQAIAGLLLHQALADRLPAVSKTPLARAVIEGVLLFRATDSSTWTLCLTRESEGRCRALVRRRHTADLRRMIASASFNVVEAVVPDWDEVSGFDSADLADPVNTAPALAHVRALQRVGASAQIHLVGGLRTDSGFLGTATLLPEVRCRDAATISVYINVGEAVNAPALVEQLVPVTGRPDSFSWPCPRQTMGGSRLLVASNEAGEVATRRIAFESAVVGEDFKTPSDPARWVAEGGSKDVVTADAIDAFLIAVKPRWLSFGGASEPTAGDASISLHHRLVDDEREFDDMVEALASIALRKQGVAEADFLRIMQAVGVLTPGVPTWDVVRAWVEAGYVDVLTNPRWRGRTYFARRPRLVAIPSTDGSVRVVLHGLASRATRHRVRNEFARAGIAQAAIASLSPYVPVPLVWRMDSDLARIDELARGVGLSLVWAAQPSSMIGSLDEVFAVDASPPVAHTLLRCWDWAESGFRVVTRGASEPPKPSRPTVAIGSRDSSIVVEYHARVDGPDEYRVGTDDGGTIAVTRSRTWALLRAFSAARRSPFSPLGDRWFRRIGKDGPFVPLPAARALQLWSGILSGPADIAGTGRVYVYATMDSGSRRWILDALSGRRVDAGAGRTLTWLLAAASAHRGVRVPIPRELRRRLEEMVEMPDAIALASALIPPSLLPHLRRAVSPGSTPQHRTA